MSSCVCACKLIAILLLVASQLVSGAGQMSISTEHDMTKPTYGLHGQSSSAVTYDDRNGLNLKGTINDILGPPIKMANGFSNMISGSNMAGVGSSLKASGAMLGIDAKLLEAAGGADILKGGLLLGGSAAKTGAATALAGTKGKKISSIIEMPVKVVAMKDIATGKTVAGFGKMKEAEAIAAKNKGATMIKEGEAMKAQGMNQVVQGATEGLQNIGNIVQQTAGNAATAIKLLPIMFDFPMGPQQQQQQQQLQQTEKGGQIQQHTSGPTSLFGGLSSLLPGLNNANDPLAAYNRQNPFNLFGQNGHNQYAAVLNSTNPLASLFMNPAMNPFLLPIGQGPLGQAIQGKQPIGANGQASTYNYNLFPGLKVSETMSSQMPQAANQHLQQQQQQVEAPKA